MAKRDATELQRLEDNLAENPTEQNLQMLNEHRQGMPAFKRGAK